MTQPRDIRPGVTYMLERRTTTRAFLFRPDEDGTMQNLFWYCLIVSALKHGVLIHSVTLMSTHHHSIVTDVRGVMPDFVHDFHVLLSCAVALYRGWSHGVFDSRKPSYVELSTAEAQIDKMGYTGANPAASGAVKYSRDWPGAWVHPNEIGRKTVRAECPSVYFAKKKWQPTVEMKLTLPPKVLEAFGEEGGRRAIAAAVERYERQAHARAKLEGYTFGNAKKSMRVEVTDRATSPDKKGLNPTFASGGDARVRTFATKTVRAFREAYRAALAKWRVGGRDALFPAGTWWMRVFHGVACAPVPDPWLTP